MSGCKLQKVFRKAKCCFEWRKFEEITECIMEVSGMHLEIANFVTPKLDETMRELIENTQKATAESELFKP